MVVPTPGYGELSVRYFPALGRWMLLAEELTRISNRIVAYVADAPEGPWGEPYVVHDMGNAAFRDNYCCAVEDNCLGEQMFNCARTGFYGTYLLPEVIETASSFTITYTMSSFSPYNVALVQTTFATNSTYDRTMRWLMFVTLLGCKASGQPYQGKDEGPPSRQA